MKLEANLSPYLTLVEGTTPASPPAGDQRLFVDSADHVLKWVDSSGVVHQAGTPADLTDIPTAETDTAKRLAPNGAGGVGWVAGGGGLTIADGPWYAPWCAPGSPDAANAEFTGSQLSGMTHIYNTGAQKGTWTEKFSAADFIETVAGTSGELDAWAQARSCSIGDYVEIAYRLTSVGTDLLAAFIGFADGVTFGDSGSHVVGAFLTNNGAAYHSMLNIWDGYNTRTTDGNTRDAASVGSYVAARVKYEAANTWGLYVSLDGTNWYAVQTNYAKTLTPTYVVFGVGQHSNPAAGRQVSIEYFRVNS